MRNIQGFAGFANDAVLAIRTTITHPRYRGTHGAPPAGRLRRHEICHARPRRAQLHIVSEALYDEQHVYEPIARIDNLDHLVLPKMQKSKCTIAPTCAPQTVSLNGRGINPPRL